MTYRVSVHFFGRYRPAIYQADSLRLAVGKARRAIAACDAAARDKLDSWLSDCAHKMESMHISGIATEHGGLGVSINQGAHDPWLDSALRRYGAFPGLDYSGAVSELA